jgi:RNA polymerase sigma-70 factor (ECF subfamily)
VQLSDAAVADFEEALTSEIYTSAWRYCFYLCARREDSEDLLQDALAHAMRKHGQLRDPAGFRAWLMAVIRTRFITGLRRRRFQVEEFEERVTAQADCGLLADAVAGALQLLPAMQREILILFYVEDLQLAEVATILRISSTSVSQRLFRARRSLRRALDAQAVYCGAGSAPKEL